jgi:hypothetical protein
METGGDSLLWILVFAYALHILEEYFMDWQSWAEQLARRPVSWTDFYLINAAVIIGGICMAVVGWQIPSFSLMLPALMLINGILVHLLPSLIRWQYAPGLVTAVVLFVPLGVWAFYTAFEDGVLTHQILLLASLGGVVLMLVPLALQRMKQI